MLNFGGVYICMYIYIFWDANPLSQHASDYQDDYIFVASGILQSTSLSTFAGVGFCIPMVLVGEHFF